MVVYTRDGRWNTQAHCRRTILDTEQKKLSMQMQCVGPRGECRTKQSCRTGETAVKVNVSKPPCVAGISCAVLA